jgi:hypothetical protein
MNASPSQTLAAQAAVHFRFSPNVDRRGAGTDAGANFPGKWTTACSTVKVFGAQPIVSILRENPSRDTHENLTTRCRRYRQDAGDWWIGRHAHIAVTPFSSWIIFDAPQSKTYVGSPMFAETTSSSMPSEETRRRI